MSNQFRFYLPAVLAVSLCCGLDLRGGDKAPKKEAPPDAAKDKGAYPGRAAPYQDERAGWPDSFRYYGPNGLWKSWTPEQKEGRDTWIFWTGGNQKFLRLATLLGGGLKLPISLEYYRMLDSRNRPNRFRTFGLVNEPNCVQAQGPEADTGLWLDVWKKDPEGYYPDTKVYGEPSGIVGLRKFRNPKFWGGDGEATQNRAKWQQMRKGANWDLSPYFQAPAKFEPPYLVGFSCGFCHVGFDPTNPPRDPANPRWENLAANIGNQYFREGDIFFGRGRIVFGDRNGNGKDPYQTAGLGPGSLLYQYAVTQPAGTSETSRISYDFINNPTIINSVMNLSHRPTFIEKTLDGKYRVVNHVLTDGADSVGLPVALLRVWINIGCEGRYWIDSLFNFGTGERQRPLDIDELLLTEKVSPERKRELLDPKKYGPDLGQDWKEAWRRNPNLIAYLTSYGGYPLKQALDRLEAQAKATKDEAEAKRLRDLVGHWRPDQTQLQRGKEVFARQCVQCHSSKLPGYPLDRTAAEHRQRLRQSVFDNDFLVNNTLSNDERYSVALLGTNMARALGTNAIDGDIWARFSSVTYKSLPPVGTFELNYAIDNNGRLQAKERYKIPAGAAPAKGPPPTANPAKDVRVRFTPPGGGRGYYRSPTLVSMWATAPYLHNNSVGDYWVVKRDDKGQFLSRERFENKDGQFPKEEIDVSVEGRLLMFQDGVEKLLWPEKRHHSILRTQQACRIFDLQAVLKNFLSDVLPGLLRDRAFEFLADKLSAAVEGLALQDKGLPPAQVEQLRQQLEGVIRQELLALRQQAGSEGLSALRKRLEDQLEKGLTDKISKFLSEALVKTALTKFAAARKEVRAEIDDLLLGRFLQVPAGTPVNLYFNLPLGAVPYALQAHIRYRNDPRRLAETLLRLSDCPDLVEDCGHEFGRALSDADKRALIEFLKTF